MPKADKSGITAQKGESLPLSPDGQTQPVFRHPFSASSTFIPLHTEVVRRVASPAKESPAAKEALDYNNNAHLHSCAR